MTHLADINMTIEEPLTGIKLDSKEEKETKPCSSWGTSRIRSLEKSVRVEGLGVTEIAMLIDLRREALRRSNLIANKYLDSSVTTP